MRFHKVWSSTVSMRRFKALPWIQIYSWLSVKQIHDENLFRKLM